MADTFSSTDYILFNFWDYGYISHTDKNIAEDPRH